MKNIIKILIRPDLMLKTEPSKLKYDYFNLANKENKLKYLSQFSAERRARENTLFLDIVFWVTATIVAFLFVLLVINWK